MLVLVANDAAGEGINLLDAPTWCNIVQPMIGGSPDGWYEGTESEKTADVAYRASVSFLAELYGTLEAIARRNKASVAWAMRDAAERHVAKQCPLFATKKRERDELHG